MSNEGCNRGSSGIWLLKIGNNLAWGGRHRGIIPEEARGGRLPCPRQTASGGHRPSS